MYNYCTLQQATTIGLLTPTEAMRLRLATYFERYPVLDSDDMVGSYGIRVTSGWAVDLILRGDEPAPYDVDIDCHRRVISAATHFIDQTCCVNCGVYHYNLPVYLAQPTVISCNRCMGNGGNVTTTYQSGVQAYNPCRY